jgi:general secretion pathway protein B
MSFILDALKKSESERLRKGTPGIADVPQSSGASGRSRWMWIIGVLLAINLAVLVVLLSRPGPSEPVARQESVIALPKPRDSAATLTPSFSDLVADAKRDQPVAAATEIPPVREPQPTPATVLPAPAITTSRVVDGPPTFGELRANGTLLLQDLHLDIHVFSNTVSERFVFINMNRYREGATLDEGPRVAEITPEGVILEHTGLRFLLPRE